MNYDNYLIPFGKFKFTALCRLPSSYLLNIHGNDALMRQYPEIKQYVEDNMDALKSGNGITKYTIPDIPMPCDKYCYLSEREASKELARINDLDTKSIKIPIRYYYCSKCGAYHLTSKEKWIENESDRQNRDYKREF